MNYQIGWLSMALERCLASNTVHGIRGDATVDEFIHEWCGEELNKIVELRMDKYYDNKNN